MQQPIAKQLHESTDEYLASLSKKPKIMTLEDQIALLEKELCNSSSSSETSDEDDEQDDSKVLCISEYALDRIEPLPVECLPKPTTLPVVHARKKQKQKQLPKGKIPFCCRPCRFIGSNLNEFQAHRASKEHVKGVEEALKKLYCGICRKQFNSQDQLDEHRKGKWHLQRKRSRR